MGKKKNYNNANRNNRQQARQFPTDHQQTENTAKTFQTSSGFRYQITENLSDMRLIDALATMQDPTIDEGVRTVACVRALRMLLGEDQKEALFAHVVKKRGWAEPASVTKEMMEIIANFGESKKK